MNYKFRLFNIIFILTIPIILIIGVCIGDRNYYLISNLIILTTTLAFFLSFEIKRNRTAYIVIISVMSTIAVISRIAFAFIPQFKPVSAVIIVTAIHFGKQAGFITGAITALMSNMFFGQGPWTPWQMFCWGIIGFIAGNFKYKKTRFYKYLIYFYSIISGYIYGLFINLWVILSSNENITWELIISTYTLSFPFDTIHSISTLTFIIILLNPLSKKINRIKTKFDI